MFKIRKGMMEAFAADAVKDFEDRMVAHVRRLLPSACAASDASIRRRIRSGIERARAYGIVSERGVCMYVDTMFAYGDDFDNDPASRGRRPSSGTGPSRARSRVSSFCSMPPSGAPSRAARLSELGHLGES